MQEQLQINQFETVPAGDLASFLKEGKNLDPNEVFGIGVNNTDQKPQFQYSQEYASPDRQDIVMGEHVATITAADTNFKVIDMRPQSTTEDLELPDGSKITQRTLANGVKVYGDFAIAAESVQTPGAHNITVLSGIWSEKEPAVFGREYEGGRKHDIGGGNPDLPLTVSRKHFSAFHDRENGQIVVQNAESQNRTVVWGKEQESRTGKMGQLAGKLAVGRQN